MVSYNFISNKDDYIASGPTNVACRDEKDLEIDSGGKSTSIRHNPANCADEILKLRECSLRFWYSPLHGFCSCEKEAITCETYWNYAIARNLINQYQLAEGSIPYQLIAIR